jgi:hypothetical protein
MKFTKASTTIIIGLIVLSCFVSLYHVEPASAIPTYSIVFNQTGLPSGASWSVTLNGNTQTSTTSSLTISNLPNGAYTYIFGAPSGYYPTPPSGSTTISNSNPNVPVNFQTVPQPTLGNWFYGGSTTDDYGYGIAATADGGYAIAGSYGSSFSDFWLIKVDSTGVAQWNKTYTRTGTSTETAYCIALCADGGYAIAGK